MCINKLFAYNDTGAAGFLLVTLNGVGGKCGSGDIHKCDFNTGQDYTFGMPLTDDAVWHYFHKEDGCSDFCGNLSGFTVNVTLNGADYLFVKPLLMEINFEPCDEAPTKAVVDLTDVSRKI